MTSRLMNCLLRVERMAIFEVYSLMLLVFDKSGAILFSLKGGKQSR